MQNVKQLNGKPVVFQFYGTEEQFTTTSVGCLVFVLEFLCWVTPERLLYALPQLPHTNESVSWNVKIKILKTDLYIVY